MLQVYFNNKIFFIMCVLIFDISKVEGSLFNSRYGISLPIPDLEYESGTTYSNCSIVNQY
jgi:hypothetical protein